MFSDKEALSIIRNWKKTNAMLPEGFDWGERIDLFLEAINHDYPLPGDWDLWTKTLSIESKTSNELSVAHWAAQRGYVFPDDFKFWGLKDAQGDPVIHALLKGFWSPPSGFKDWSITDNKGIPATHIYLANIRKPFPDGFDAWSVRSPIGSTAAHMAVLAAASERTPGLAWLPEDRAIWMLRDRAGWEGETVLHLAARCGVAIPALFSREDWEICGPVPGARAGGAARGSPDGRPDLEDGVMTAIGKEERVVNFDQAADIIKHWKTSKLRLPSDFDWSTRKEGHIPNGPGSFHVRMPLLDLAIKTGYPLPDDHALWSQRIERFEGGWFTVAHYAVQQGNIFDFSFSHWGLKDCNGRPVIHALIHSRMTPPAHFSQWEIKNERGLSAAHAYLYSLRKPLPEGFTAWAIRDELGWTTAHVAMKLAADTGQHEIACLPEDRALWLLEKDLERPAPEGTRAGTVLHAAAGRGLPVPDIFSIEDWHLKNEHGYSVIDLARKGMNRRLIAQYEALVLAAQLADRPTAARISRNVP